MSHVCSNTDRYCQDDHSGSGVRTIDGVQRSLGQGDHLLETMPAKETLVMAFAHDSWEKSPACYTAPSLEGSVHRDHSARAISDSLARTFQESGVPFYQSVDGWFLLLRLLPSGRKVRIFLGIQNDEQGVSGIRCEIEADLRFGLNCLGEVKSFCHRRNRDQALPWRTVINGDPHGIGPFELLNVSQVDFKSEIWKDAKAIGYLLDTIFAAGEAFIFEATQFLEEVLEKPGTGGDRQEDSRDSFRMKRVPGRTSASRPKGVSHGLEVVKEGRRLQNG